MRKLWILEGLGAISEKFAWIGVDHVTIASLFTRVRSCCVIRVVVRPRSDACRILLSPSVGPIVVRRVSHVWPVRSEPRLAYKPPTCIRASLCIRATSEPRSCRVAFSPAATFPLRSEPRPYKREACEISRLELEIWHFSPLNQYFSYFYFPQSPDIIPNTRNTTRSTRRPGKKYLFGFEAPTSQSPIFNKTSRFYQK